MDTGHGGSFIDSCFNKGSVAGTGESLGIGGICGGIFEKCGVESCYNQGIVSGYGQVGGICGFARCSIKNCYNSGKVTCSDSKHGGIVGHLSTDFVKEKDIENCFWLIGTSDVVCGAYVNAYVENMISDENMQKLADVLKGEFENTTNGYPKLSWEPDEETSQE